MRVAWCAQALARSAAGFATAALVAMLAACGQDNRYVAPPVPRVTVALPVQQKVTRYLEANGNAAAVNSIVPNSDASATTCTPRSRGTAMSMALMP